MKLFILCFLLPLLLSTSLSSCKKTRPQLPANKTESSEENKKKELEEINKTLISREDSLLQIYVASQTKTYLKNEFGFWHTSIGRKSDDKNLKPEEKYRISYQNYLIDGRLVEEEKDITIKAGRKETINGIELALQLLHKGDSVELIIPWYLAYGALGKSDLIPPYSSLVCKLKIHDN